MGGMHTLEWRLCTASGYVQNIIPIATSAYHSAWGISWSETQRQAIFTDAAFKCGWYKAVPKGQPRSGLGTARMIGMLTYRSFGSFETRFGRKHAVPVKRIVTSDALPTPPSSETGSISSDTGESEEAVSSLKYSVQSYLHYQAEKFLNRFDANCYVHLTRKMDTHDVTRSRSSSRDSGRTPTAESLTTSLKIVPKGALVIGVQTDMLFLLQQQIEIAHCLPEADFVALQSGDGHDGFLLEFESLDKIIREHLMKRCAWVYEGLARIPEDTQDAVVGSSVFSETESIEF